MGNRYVDHRYPSSGVSHVLILVAHFHRVGWQGFSVLHPNFDCFTATRLPTTRVTRPQQNTLPKYEKERWNRWFALVYHRLRKKRDHGVKRVARTIASMIFILDTHQTHVTRNKRINIGSVGKCHVTGEK